MQGMPQDAGMAVAHYLSAAVVDGRTWVR